MISDTNHHFVRRRRRTRRRNAGIAVEDVERDFANDIKGGLKVALLPVSFVPREFSIRWRPPARTAIS